MLRLSAVPSDRSTPTVAQIAALAIRLGVSFASIATVEQNTPLRRHRVASSL